MLKILILVATLHKFTSALEEDLGRIRWNDFESFCSSRQACRLYSAPQPPTQTSVGGKESGYLYCECNNERVLTKTRDENAKPRGTPPRSVDPIENMGPILWSDFELFCESRQQCHLYCSQPPFHTGIGTLWGGEYFCDCNNIRLMNGTRDESAPPRDPPPTCPPDPNHGAAIQPYYFMLTIISTVIFL